MQSINQWVVSRYAWTQEKMNSYFLGEVSLPQDLSRSALTSTHLAD